MTKTIKPVPAIEKAIAEATKPADPKPGPALPQDLQQAINTVAAVCDSAPVSGPNHRAWQQALDKIAQALLAAQKA